ncbi:MAG: glycosyltransferase family 2 protein [bacterium]
MSGAGPKISVITAVYNGREVLPGLLESIREQTWPLRELLVSDGGSTDRTPELLREAGETVTWWTSSPDRGIYDAWNRALEHTAGEWVLFLGADDRLASPTALEEAAGELRGLPSRIRVAYGMLRQVDPSGEVIAALGGPWEQVRKGLEHDLTLPHPATFHRRDLFTDHGLFDPTYQIAGDYEFLLRELPEREAAFLADVTVTEMAVGGISDDPSAKVRQIIEVERARSEHGLRGLPPEWSARVLRARIHRLLDRLLGRETALALVNLYRRLAGKEPLRK